MTLAVVAVTVAVAAVAVLRAPDIPTVSPAGASVVDTTRPSARKSWISYLGAAVLDRRACHGALRGAPGAPRV